MKRAVNPEARPVLGMARGLVVGVVLWLAVALAIYLVVKG